MNQCWGPKIIMGTYDNITDWKMWRTLKYDFNHEIRVLNVRITSLKEELIKVIHLPELPKYLEDKKEDLIRSQRNKELLKRIVRALERNIKGVEDKQWFKENPKYTILKKSKNYLEN